MEDLSKNHLVTVTYVKATLTERSYTTLLDSTSAALADAGPCDVLGPPVGLVIAELDQATSLTCRSNRVIRQSVSLPSVTNNAARDALDVHVFSVSVFAFLRQTPTRLT